MMQPPRKKSDWAGCRVRLREDVRTGLAVLPKGTEMLIETGVGRINLVGTACSCCGIQARLRLKPREAVLLEFLGPASVTPAVEATM